jgi:hypothetical protein
VLSAFLEKGQQRLLSLQLHQYCFYPRAILTPSDAVFVARFIRVAHDLGAAGFSTLFAYSNVRGSVSASKLSHSLLRSFLANNLPPASSRAPRTRRAILADVSQLS